MVAKNDEFLSGGDLDDLLMLVEGGFLDEDVDFNVDMDDAISQISCNLEKKDNFQCSECGKVMKSGRRLTRHRKAKHQQKKNSSLAEELSNTHIEEEELLKKLHPLKLRVIVLECVSILHKEMCVQEHIRNVFLDFNFSVEESVELWNKFETVIKSFNGSAEKNF